MILGLQKLRWVCWRVTALTGTLGGLCSSWVPLCFPSPLLGVFMDARLMWLWASRLWAPFNVRLASVSPNVTSSRASALCFWRRWYWVSLAPPGNAFGGKKSRHAERPGVYGQEWRLWWICCPKHLRLLLTCLRLPSLPPFCPFVKSAPVHAASELQG